MASFQDKIGWKMSRNKKIKIIGPSVPFQLNTKLKIPKEQQKNKKQRKREHREREKIKNIIPFHSVQTRRILENSKKVAKKLKKLKNTIMASFLAKIGGKCGVERDKIKIIITFRSYPTRNRKFKKKTKKLKKKYHYGFISSQYRLEKNKKERK